LSVYGQYIGIAMINLMNQLYVRSLLALSVAGVLGLAAVGYLTSPPPDQPLLVTAPTPSASQGTNQPAEIRVEISGGVSQPGVISLPEGSRLIDGISAAGGWGERVDPLRVELCLNLAAPLEDGSAIMMPTRAMIGIQRLRALGGTQAVDALWPPLQRLGADASAPAGCPLPAATIRAWPSQRILRYSSPGAMTSF